MKCSKANQEYINGIEQVCYFMNKIATTTTTKPITRWFSNKNGLFNFILFLLLLLSRLKIVECRLENCGKEILWKNAGWLFYYTTRFRIYCLNRNVKFMNKIPFLCCCL